MEKTQNFEALGNIEVEVIGQNIPQDSLQTSTIYKVGEHSLTYLEAYSIYEQMKHDCHEEDILSVLYPEDDEDVSMDNDAEKYPWIKQSLKENPKILQQIVLAFENNLSKNETYCEAFWDTVRETLKNIEKEKKVVF